MRLPNPDDIFSVFEDVNFGGGNERDIEQCVGYSPPSHASKVHTVSPEANVFDKKSIMRHSNEYVDQSGDDEDESGWETVTHPDDQGSSYSADGSDPSSTRFTATAMCQKVERSGKEMGVRRHRLLKSGRYVLHLSPI